MTSQTTTFRLLCIFPWILCLLSESCDKATATAMGDSVLSEILKANYIKATSTAYQFIRSCYETTHPHIPDEYDITINKDWTYLRDLGANGWTVALAQYLKTKCESLETTSQRAECFFNALNIDGCYVAWTGGFNNGKTTIINKVTNKNFPTGYDKSGETKGFNFILLNEDEDDDGQASFNDDYDDGIPEDTDENLGITTGIVHIDTPGATRCVEPDMLQDRFMTDRFVYDVLPDMADVVVLVVDILTSNEQVLINELMQKIVSFSTAARTKELIIVHNFKTLSTKKDVQEHITSDIVKAFNNTKKTTKKWIDGKRRPAFYTSDYKGEYQITHFVFAQDHTEAAKYYNPIATEWLARQTNDMRCKARGMNVLEHFISRLQPLLREYFYTETISQKNLVQPEFDVYRAAGRVATWFHGLLNYGDTMHNKKDYIKLKFDVNKDPFKLMFKPVIGHDDFDGVIVLQNDGTLEYCQSSRIGATPQCKPKIRCAVWKNPSLWGLQCSMAGAVFSDNIDSFEEDVKSKFFVLRHGCEIIIYGTILPPWNDYVDDVNEFDLIHTDGMMHGWVEKRFKMDEDVCILYKDGAKQTHQNGKLSITVPLVTNGIGKTEL